MPSAKLVINFGKPAKYYVKILGEGKRLKRGVVSLKAKNKTLEVTFEAKDEVALISSMASAIKQLRVVSDVGSLVE